MKVIGCSDVSSLYYKKGSGCINISEKYNLTIQEAAEYFNIGEKKIRELIKEPGCQFVLLNGKKILIKKKMMEDYLCNVKYI